MLLSRKRKSKPSVRDAGQYLDPCLRVLQLDPQAGQRATVRLDQGGDLLRMPGAFTIQRVGDQPGDALPL
jgi:hypothetical protein